MRIRYIPSLAHLRRALRSHDSPLVVRPHAGTEAVAYVKPKTRDFLTPERSRHREFMRENGARWRALTEEQRGMWRRYAKAHQRELEALRRKPSVEPYHGYRLFTAVSARCVQQGIAPPELPPERLP